MLADEVGYNSGSVKPIECLREGWRLIKEDYWLFLGISFVGILIAEAVPLGLLIGPMMCGIHLCLLRQQSGQRVSFDMLFKGFEHFAESLIATLIWGIPAVIFVILFYISCIIAGVAIGIALQAQGGQAGTELLITLSAVAALFLVVMAISVFSSAMTIFIYPLIVDRNLSGFDAVRVSMRGAWANLGGVLGIVILETLIGFAGVLACSVGWIFVLPICFAMTAIAYRQVFPELDERYPDYLPEDEDEPRNPGDTGIRVMD